MMRSSRLKKPKKKTIDRLNKRTKQPEKHVNIDSAAMSKRDEVTKSKRKQKSGQMKNNGEPTKSNLINLILRLIHTSEQNVMLTEYI